MRGSPRQFNWRGSLLDWESCSACTTTGVEGDGSETFIRAEGKDIVISGASENSLVEVYNMSGNKVASKVICSSARIKVEVSGVYVVLCGSDCRKVSVF